MSAYFRNIGVVFLALIVGSALNMGLLFLGSALIPVPAGVDITDAASIAAAIDEFGPQHFLFPFLAHALGTLAGAFCCYLLVRQQRQLYAFAIGGLFLVGGISNAFMIPAPLWFVVVDRVFAYFPMAWLAILLGQYLQPASAEA